MKSAVRARPSSYPLDIVLHCGTAVALCSSWQQPRKYCAAACPPSAARWSHRTACAASTDIRVRATLYCASARIWRCAFGSPVVARGRPQRARACLASESPGSPGWDRPLSGATQPACQWAVPAALAVARRAASAAGAAVPVRRCPTPTTRMRQQPESRCSGSGCIRVTSTAQRPGAAGVPA